MARHRLVAALYSGQTVSETGHGGGCGMEEMMTHGGLLVAEILKREGVEVVFTLSGGHIAAIYDGCLRRGIPVMGVRHGQGAGPAAQGWAKGTPAPRGGPPPRGPRRTAR